MEARGGRLRTGPVTARGMQSVTVQQRIDPVAYGLFWPRSRRRAFTITLLVMSDVAAVMGAGLLAGWIRFQGEAAVLALPAQGIVLPYTVLAIVIACTWPILFAGGRLYDVELLFWGAGEFRRAVRTITVGTFWVIAIDYALKADGISREWLALMWGLSVLLVIAGRLICRRLVRWLRSAGLLRRPALIVGDNDEAVRLERVMRQDDSLGIWPLACLRRPDYNVDDRDLLAPGVPIIGTAGQLCEKLDSTGADAVVIASSAFSHDYVSQLLSGVRSKNVDVYVSSGLYEVLSSRVVMREFNGVPIIAVRGVSLTPSKLAFKRAFDLVLASLVVVLGLPIWLVVALCIKLDSRGPVFFRQERVGHKGERFRMFKFRSMHIDAEKRLADLKAVNEADGAIFKIKNDPRITRVGRWLRRYSIDEFPQLLNVLKGEMSLVGPRPPLPSEVSVYEERHWRRLEAWPGMTGLWQVSGRSDLSFDEMVRLDIYYIENWALLFDMTILARTLPAVLSSRGAY